MSSRRLDGRESDFQLGLGIVRVRCSSLFVFHLGRRLFGDDEKERPAALLTSSHLSLARLFLFIHLYARTPTSKDGGRIESSFVCVVVTQRWRGK